MTSSKAFTGSKAAVQPVAAGGLGWVRQHLFEVVPVEMLERQVSEPLPWLSQVSGLQITRVDRAQPGDWRELVPRAQWRNAERSLARGDWGHLGVIEDDFAGRIWVSRTSHRDPWSGLRIRLAPDEAYFYAMEVVPRYRPRGAAAALVSSALSDLYVEGGVTRVYGWVDSRNRQPLLLLHIVFGFRRVQTVKRAHLLRRIGWQVRGSDRPSFGPVSRVGRHAETSPG